MIAPASVIDITIREDVAPRIYAHHVLHGFASFEVEPPSETEMRQRCREVIGRGFPYLMAAYAGEIVGYAYASPYRLVVLVTLPLAWQLTRRLNRQNQDQAASSEIDPQMRARRGTMTGRVVDADANQR